MEDSYLSLIKEKTVDLVSYIGSELIKWRKSKIFDGKWVGSQFKAKVDMMAHEEYTKGLKRIAHDIPIISEEGNGLIFNDQAATYWLIDPIDGTASFINGFPGFVTQVALMERGIPTLSCIFAPLLDEMYVALRKKGSFLNGNKISVGLNSGCGTLIDNNPSPKGIARAAYHELGFNRYVECGSISLKMCKVASGEADVFIKDVVVRNWDLAAPDLVLSESGGVLTDVSGKEINYADSYEHNGVIAARSNECWKRVALFCQDFKNRSVS